MRTFGLLGYPLSHSFSPDFFSKKFKEEHIPDAQYLLFERENLAGVKDLTIHNEDLQGFNVTIPYKEKIIPHLDALDPVSKAIGAVNCVKIQDGVWTGYNTDAIGFHKSIKPFLEPQHSSALVLGSGGASKAIIYALKNLGIRVAVVGRDKTKSGVDLNYSEITSTLVSHFKLVVNTTPLGMYPKVDEKPILPYEHFTENHLLVDLIYNPEETAFLKEGARRNSMTLNGKDMLIHQAEESWRIWTDK